MKEESKKNICLNPGQKIFSIFSKIFAVLLFTKKNSLSKYQKYSFVYIRNYFTFKFVKSTKKKFL